MVENNLNIICRNLENYPLIIKMFRNIKSTQYYLMNIDEYIAISPSLIKFISKCYNFVFNIFKITENNLVQYKMIDNTGFCRGGIDRNIFDVILIFKNGRYYFIKVVRRQQKQQ